MWIFVISFSWAILAACPCKVTFGCPVAKEVTSISCHLTGAPIIPVPSAFATASFAATLPATCCA